MEAVWAAILGPLVTALLAASGVALRGLSVKRQDLSGRKRNIQVAGQTVAFIDAYLSAQQKLSPGAAIASEVSEKAARDLEQAYARMMQVTAADHDEPLGLVWGSLLNRAMLRSVRRPAAKVVRAFFYLFLVLGLVWSAIILTELVKDWAYGWAVLIFSALIVSVISLLPSVVLYWWARWLDRDRPQDGVMPPPASPAIGPASPPREPWPSPSGLPSVGDPPP